MLPSLTAHYTGTGFLVAQSFSLSHLAELVVELFAIHCTTCRARLKVNEESAIGQILACPKCGSMVQVVPPVDWQRPGAAAAATVASSAPKPAAKTTTSVQEAWSAENRSALAAHDATVSASVQQPAVASSAPAAEATASPISKVTALGQLLLGWARRDWLALSAGIVLGTGVWLVIAMTTGGESPVEVSGQVGSAAATTQEVALRHTDVEPTVPVEAAPADATETPAEPSEAAAEPTAPVDAEPKAAAPAEPKPPAEPAQTDKVVEKVAGAPTADPKMKLEPAPAAAPPADKPAAADDEASSQVNPQAAEPEQIGAVPERPGQSPGATPRMLTKSEIDDRLDQPLPSVEFSKTTLIQFVEFMQDLTGVTITIDEAALDKAGLSRQSPLSLKLSQTTAGDALRAAAERLGLQVAVQGGKIVITGPR